MFEIILKDNNNKMYSVQGNNIFNVLVKMIYFINKKYQIKR